MEAYEIAFQAYDLRKIADTMDSCVSVAKTISPYKAPLRRPTHLSRK